MGITRVRRLTTALALLLACAIGVSAQTVRYVYDAAGRLVAVIDQNGDAAIYTYDAVGNVLSIARQSAGVVSVYGRGSVTGARRHQFIFIC